MEYVRTTRLSWRYLSSRYSPLKLPIVPGNGTHWIIVEFAVANDAGYVAGILPLSSSSPGLHEASFAGVVYRLSIGLTEATVLCFLARILEFPLVMFSPLMYMFEARIEPDNIASALNVMFV